MRPSPAQRFSATAAGYAATMAPALRPVAAEVIRRAHLRPGDRVLDIGTGTGTAAELARGEGRTVIGIDAAPGMLEIARATVDGVSFAEMDFDALSYADGAFDAVLAVHCLHFSDDQAVTLREWLRVTSPGGRLSFSVPGPREAGPNALYAEVYARHGVKPVDRYRPSAELRQAALSAGWDDVSVEADPDTAITLAGESAFRLWRETGFRGAATDGFSDEAQRRLTDDMLSMTPMDASGALRVPFGTLYLTARTPS